MSGYTPGPWKAKNGKGKYDNRRNSWTVTDEDAGCSEAAPITLSDGTVVAFAVASDEDYFSEDRTDANARLIAAAPALLEALRGCLEVMGRSFGNGKPVPINCAEAVAAFAAIRQATEGDKA